MEQFLFKVAAEYSCKNKLYEEFQAFAVKNDRTLIVGKKALKAFNESFRAQLKALEYKHNRCKPLRFEIDNGYSKDVYASYSDHGSWRGYIYKVEKVIPVN